MASPTATLSLIKTTDSTSKTHLISSLSSTTPASTCTTDLLFTPTTSPKAPSQLIPADSKDLFIGRMQIHSSPPTNAASPSDATGDTTSWIPTSGFVLRPSSSRTEKASIVMLAKFVARAAKRDQLVRILGDYAAWVKDNEQGVLTYSVMVSADNENEVLMFERYKDGAALKGHGGSKEFKTMFKATGPHIEGKKTKLNQFDEVSGFVGEVEGAKAKL